jgi:hypothetical protein
VNRVRIIKGLPFIALEVQAGGQTLTLDNVLVDSGSAACVFPADQMSELGLVPLPGDRFFRIRGVGGYEYVFEKQIDSIKIGQLTVENFSAEVGAIDYGFAVDGIIGVYFLLATKAKLDFRSMELS